LHRNKIKDFDTNPHSDLHKEKINMVKKKKETKKEVHEIVKITKDGKEKIKDKNSPNAVASLKEETKEFSRIEKEKHATKNQIKRQNKQIGIILGVLGVVILAFLLFLLISYKTINFNYEGIKFKIVKEGDLIFYNTFFKMYNEEGAHVADYNFYIRKDPRKLEKDILFEMDEFILTDNMVLNMTEDFNCEGDGIIAVANFVKVHEFFGMNVIQDPTAGCELTGKYTFVRIIAGNETKIEKYGPSCYKISINDCEILEGTERFMLETFIKANEVLNK